MLCEGLQKFFIAEKFFKHLRGHLDEIALSRKSREPRPLCMTPDDCMHQVAKLVKESNDVGVLQQPGIAAAATRKVANERSFRQRAPANSGNNRRCGKPLVLAVARMHVEIEAAHVLVGIKYVEHRNRLVPGLCGRGPKLHLEQSRRRLQHTSLHLRVWKIRPHGLRIEIKRGAAELLIPIAAAGCVDGCKVRVSWACEVENQFMLAARPAQAGFVKFPTPKTPGP